jgi:hypothetical protein
VRAFSFYGQVSQQGAHFISTESGHRLAIERHAEWAQASNV